MSFKDVSSDENSHPPAFCLVNYVVVFRDGESKIIPLYHAGWLVTMWAVIIAAQLVGL